MYPEINTAIKYLQDRNYKTPVDVLRYIANPKAMKQGGDYYAIRSDLWAAMYDSVYNFLSSQEMLQINVQIGTITRPLAVKITQAYMESADIAYVAGGGTLPLDEDTNDFVRSSINEQLAYMDSLFQRLKQLRKDGDFDAIQEAFDRASGYTQSLDSFYNNIKLAGAGNKMLTFGGNDGKESCKDCTRLKGQRHRASWWIGRGYVPPSREFECQGYHCEHRLYDDDGMEFTI